MVRRTSQTRRLSTYKADQSDDVFICCASFEERCLGTLRRFENYRFRHGYVFVYDEPDEKRESHLREIEEILNNSGSFVRIAACESDPVPSIARLSQELRQLKLSGERSVVTVDITTFTKRHLLLLLKHLDEMGFWNALRLFYTEPRDYVTDLYLPMSIGLREKNPMPGFVSTQSLNKPVLLIIFLGYEGDRAMALFSNVDPNEALLVIPRPAYHKEWEGRTERMNRNLISLLGEEKIKYANSRDAQKAAFALSQILDERGEYNLENWSCCISPLGTKPQALGLYLFWREHSGQFSVIYAQPVKHNENFYSAGIGRTWLLLAPNQE